MFKYGGAWNDLRQARGLCRRILVGAGIQVSGRLNPHLFVQVYGLAGLLILLSLPRWQIYFVRLLAALMMLTSCLMTLSYMRSVEPLSLLLACLVAYLALPLLTSRRAPSFSQLRPVNERKLVDAGIPMDRVESPRPIIINVPPPVYSPHGAAPVEVGHIALPKV